MLLSRHMFQILQYVSNILFQEFEPDILTCVVYLLSYLSFDQQTKISFLFIAFVRISRSQLVSFLLGQLVILTLHVIITLIIYCLACRHSTRDIPFIRSLAINQSNRYNKYSRDYTKSGLYIVKFGYWIARNLLFREPEVMVNEPSITKLQVFAGKLTLLKNRTPNMTDGI